MTSPTKTFDAMQRLENNLIDLEIAMRDTAQEINTRIERLRDLRRQHAATRQALAAALHEDTA